MENIRGKMKSPTNKEKILQYEKFLHKINMFCISGNNEGIKELVENADIWSYSHRVGNGEFSERKQQQAINNAFWKLLDTPKADKDAEERQKFWAEAKDRILKQKEKILK
jgi:hypothetical protein